MFGGMGKKFGVCGYAFYGFESCELNLSQITVLHTFEVL